MTRLRIDSVAVTAAGLALALGLPALAQTGGQAGEPGCLMSGMQGQPMQQMQHGMGGMGRGMGGMRSGMHGMGGGMHGMGGGMHGMGGGMHGMMGQRGMMRGRGMGRPGMMQGGMMQRGMMPGGGTPGSGAAGGMGGNMADMQQIHALLSNHRAIQRAVRKLPDGVETVTTSSDPRVAALLPEHVQAMYARLKEGRLIRGFDPLFVALFRQADQIEIQVERLKDGVRVVETSRDPQAVRLIQAHAEAVNGFVKDGMAAMHRTHPVPAQPGSERR
jgi:hypothetical protein